MKRLFSMCVVVLFLIGAVLDRTGAGLDLIRGACLDLIRGRVWI